MADSTNIKILPVEFWVGDTTLLTRPCAAILNSRQAKHLDGNSPWIRNTLKAVSWVAEHEMTLVCGIDLPSWEIGLWATGEVLGYSATLVPVPDWANIDVVIRTLNDTIDDFGLMPQHSLMIPFVEQNPRSPKKSWLDRDTWILEKASTLLPVSIRPGGFFEKKHKTPDPQQNIVTDFKVSYNSGSGFKPTIPESFKSLEQLGEWDYLTHWTRSTSRKWPGETSASFYKDIITQGDTYKRSAFETLKHILAEQMLRASGWRMAQKTPMVAFSSAHPSDMLKNMVWRRQRVAYTFEPYGIGIKTRAAKKAGITRVRYGTTEEKKKLTAAERIYFQTDNSEEGVWKKEMEHRYRGDVVLSQFDPSDLLILVPTEAEKEIIRAEFGLPAFALTDQ